MAVLWKTFINFHNGLDLLFCSVERTLHGCRSVPIFFKAWGIPSYSFKELARGSLSVHNCVLVWYTSTWCLLWAITVRCPSKLIITAQHHFNTGAWTQPLAWEEHNLCVLVEDGFCVALQTAVLPQCGQCQKGRVELPDTPCQLLVNGYLRSSAELHPRHTNSNGPQLLTALWLQECSWNWVLPCLCLTLSLNLERNFSAGVYLVFIVKLFSFVEKAN